MTTMRVIGAGIARTGTTSLKNALEHLTGGRCYHGWELLGRPQDVPLWEDCIAGRPDWDALFAGYATAIDWPTAAFWPELSVAYPDALVLLSTRPSEDWWDSVNTTVFPVMHEEAPPPFGPMRAMQRHLLATRFTEGWMHKDEAIRAYEAHNARVRAEVDPARLIDWQIGDEWEPLCRALGAPVPQMPFPYKNARAEMQAVMQGDEPPAPTRRDEGTRRG